MNGCICVPRVPSMMIVAQVLKHDVEQGKVSATNNFFRELSRDADLVADSQLFLVSHDAQGLIEIPACQR